MLESVSSGYEASNGFGGKSDQQRPYMYVPSFTRTPSIARSIRPTQTQQDPELRENH